VYVALVIWHEKRMRRILSSVASLALSYFSILSHRRHYFRGGGGLLNIKCVLWFSLQLLSKILLILRRIKRDTITNARRFSCTILVILVRFQWNLNILERFSEKHKYKMSGKFAQWGPSCNTYRRTDGQRHRHGGAKSRC